MAKKKFKEKPQQVFAAQWDGSNLADLEEIAPGLIRQDFSGTVWLNLPTTTDAKVNVTDWVMDDPVIGFPTVCTDASFSARFDKQPV
jgi:hypothetical protein